MTDVSKRLAGVRARMEAADVQALFVRDCSNVTYLTGFVGVWDSEPSSVVVVTAEESWIVTDSRFEEAATLQAAGGPYRVMVPATQPWVFALSELEKAGVDRLAVEGSVPHRLYERLGETFGGDLVSAPDWVEKLRAVKEPEEIGCIERAQALTDQAWQHILGYVCAGMSEAQVALELEFFMRSSGSEGVAFPPIVASGPNSALPHARPGRRVLQAGDFLKMDFGACVDGYCADMTRTVVLGGASRAQLEIYDVVLAANLAGIAAVREGAPGCEVDRAARSVIETAGFGERFGHGLGHGVGLAVHELPGVGQRSATPLVTANVITVEPGVYIPGFGGVRIEDLVVVEDSGARVLTRSAKELIEL